MQLFAYQQHVYEWAKPRPAIGLLLDMRLGKTVIATEWAKAKLGRLLVVCPKSVAPVWEEHLQEHAKELPWWTVVNYEKLIRGGQRTLGGKVRAVPSDTAMRLADLQPDTIILDESTRIKNPQAQVTKVIMQRFRDVPYRAILTGRINPNDPLEIVQQMLFLNGVFMGCTNYYRFRDRWFEPSADGYTWVPKRGTLDAMKAEMDKCCFTLFRKDVGLANEKVRLRRYVHLPQKVRTAYDRAEKDMVLGDTYTNWKLVARQWLVGLAGGRPEPLKGYAAPSYDGKLDELVRLLPAELADEPVVVWFARKSLLYAAEDALSAAHISCSTITGETDSMSRHHRLRNWKRGVIRVLLCMVQCSKYGVDYSHASAAVYMGNSDRPEDRMQSEDRIEHPLKKDTLLYVDILAKDTIDEDIYESLVVRRLTGEAFLRNLYKLGQARRQLQCKAKSS